MNDFWKSYDITHAEYGAAPTIKASEMASSMRWTVPYSG